MRGDRHMATKRKNGHNKPKLARRKTTGMTQPQRAERWHAIGNRGVLLSQDDESTQSVVAVDPHLQDSGPRSTRLRAIIEEMHRHVVGALTAVHSSESPTIPVRLVGKWVTEFDDVLSAGSAQTTETPSLLARCLAAIETAITDEDGLDGVVGERLLREAGYWPPDPYAASSSDEQAPPEPTRTLVKICRRCGFAYEITATICDDPSAPGAGNAGVCGGTLASSDEQAEGQ